MSPELTFFTYHSYRNTYNAPCRLFLSILQCTPENSPEIPSELYIYIIPFAIAYDLIPLLWILVLRVSKGVVRAEAHEPIRKPGMRLVVKLFQVKSSLF